MALGGVTTWAAAQVLDLGASGSVDGNRSRTSLAARSGQTVTRSSDNSARLRSIPPA